MTHSALRGRLCSYIDGRVRGGFGLKKKKKKASSGVQLCGGSWRQVSISAQSGECGENVVGGNVTLKMVFSQ